MEWHAIVGRTFAGSHGSAFDEEEESGKIRQVYRAPCAEERSAHSNPAYRDLEISDRNFAFATDAITVTIEQSGEILSAFSDQRILCSRSSLKFYIVGRKTSYFKH